MNRCGWMWRCLLLTLAVQAVGVGQSNDRREINGAKTPEKIPDRYAYPALFDRLSGPDAEERRKTFLRDSRMAEADAIVVFREAERFEQFSTEGMSRIADARKNAPRPLPAPVMDMYRVLNERANDAVETSKRSFEHEISAGGQQQLQAYLLNHVRRSMSVHLGDADMAAGLGPVADGPGTTTRATPAAPTLARPRTEALRPGAPMDAKALASMEEAAKALAVLRVIDGQEEATIELWNGSPKEIVAYQVALCAPAMFLMQGLDTFWTRKGGIATGAIHELRVSKRSRPRCDPMTPRTVSVIFEDGTDVGWQQQLEHMKFGRLGRMAEIERVHRILSAAGTGELPDWAALRQQIGELPDDVEAALQAVAGSGLPWVDTAELKAASWSAQSGIFGAVTQVRATILGEISGQMDLARWAQLRDKYRGQSEGYQAFRQQSTGSLYR